ncbi:hypothetical protein vB_PsyM_KIL4_0017 [Pseudomonas phage vB_PsyM_KIL4]|uniref:Uncharacterized protein n=3 Tax=Flaumdravirus TaxID=2560133 RepID=A0A142IDX2_9CAUD|nr:RNA ligase [Pseudomonas phage vB_PsyM_KIL4]AMR57427.1 hypothetical protein vB_PsyM_KIL2_0016 [Pseudomonas phage vB_PsyM_KIL2]AMR57750.1 hypothetical protein vB_PsyM_KIL4_0017 [Pseudomonas phage vB_PsyM_KIL4]AMR57917.1 hypothetical protein vB_PsyM_KIL5_0017 [Pseudomonas phage vB_PsyM_KIL5]
MASQVYVVTSVELGWDCIVGIFDADEFSREDLQERFPSKQGYVVHWDTTIHKDLGDFD